VSVDPNLEREIQKALDAGEDPATSLEDPEAKQLASEYAQLDRWLDEWPLPMPSDDAFEAIATRVEQRLDQAGEDDVDFTQPPVFEDADARLRPRDEAEVVSSGEYDLGDLAAAAAAAPAAVAAASPPSPVVVSPAAGGSFASPPPAATAKVVDLAERRRARAGLFAVAAAAAIGLGVTGVFFLQGEAEPELAMAPAAEPQGATEERATAPASEDRASAHWASDDWEAEESASASEGYAMADLAPEELVEAEPAAEPSAQAPGVVAAAARMEVSPRRTRARSGPRPPSMTPPRMMLARGLGAATGGAADQLATMRATTSTTTASEERTKIARVERRTTPRVRACFGDTPPGRVTVQVRLDDGDVAGVDWVRGAGEHEACVLSVVSAISLAGVESERLVLRFDLR